MTRRIVWLTLGGAALLIGCAGGGGTILADFLTDNGPPDTRDRPPVTREGAPSSQDRASRTGDRPPSSTDRSPAQGGGGGSGQSAGGTTSSGGQNSSGGETSSSGGVSFDCSGRYTCVSGNESATYILTNTNNTCTANGVAVLAPNGTVTVQGQNAGTWTFANGILTVNTEEGTLTCAKATSTTSTSSGG